MPPLPAIVGHKAQLAQLLHDVESENLAHAYLFVGTAHLGKFTVARWFASQILLRGLPAEECERQEQEIARLLHPDYLVLDQLWMEDRCEDWHEIAKTSNLPQVHRSKAPKMKTDVIGIDDVRVIQDRLYETGRGLHRCCLIRGMERLRDEAANAFLKILEEPPPGRVFLLTAQSPSHVLPTVVSRTRVLHFHRVGVRDMESLVQGVPPDDARFALHIAQGAPGTVIRLRDDPDALRTEKLLHTQALSFWSARGLRERLALLEPLAERGPQADRFLVHLALALRETAGRTHRQERGLAELVQGLHTNAHRQLMAQHFALSLG